MKKHSGYSVMPDGIYFNLPEEEYHAIPALSGSGIKLMHSSIEMFWANSWMNPVRESHESEATRYGTASHTRTCEGRDAFLSQYCRRVTEDDFPDALITVEDLKRACETFGIKKSGNKADIVKRLLERDPDICILDNEIAKHAAANEGKILLSPDVMDRIEFAAAFIEKSPTFGMAFKGGYPEVTVLWTDRETGVRLKARMDYLKLGAIIEFKTFDNSQNKPIWTAIYHAIGYNRYHISAALYMDARTAAIELVKSGAVFGDVDSEWLFKFSQIDTWEWFFVFQQKGRAPATRGMQLVPGCGALVAGSQIVRHHIEEFAKYKERYGADTAWISDEPTEVCEDHLLPLAAFD